MKAFFSLSTILLISIFQAQNLKDFTVPKGYTEIVNIKGDLDKDGKDETVIAYTTNKKNKSEFNDGYQREFYILKNNGGKLKIWQKNSSVLFPSNLGFYPEDNGLPEFEIKNNCLIISQQFNTNSRHTASYTSTFRFQNNDFYLIGSVYKFDDTCEFNFLTEINFSIGKGVVDEQYSSCSDDEKVPEKNFHKEFTYKFKALPKMNTFTTGATSLKIPNSDKYFNF
ncbi:ribosomal protein L21 [Chryseobacterium sp. H1D6B]|uniref:hypothetical protein n=1 Tax=Chryseobacterium sp. H1D6B TaxID=2940588 RepID=UPI0015C72D8B|nr:hypothetical protein [Chryseobacterium sp. H1D6B]MDH6251270.1 ribosomal protein L21 [Chryseobacterium sp. H1D6B]